MENLDVNIISPFYPYKSGISSYAEDLSTALSTQGVIVKRVNQEFWRKFNFLKVYSSRLFFSANKIFAIFASFFYPRPLGNNLINHFHLSGGQHNYVVLKYFYNVRRPKIITVHETFYTRNVLNALDEIEQLKIIKNSDAVIVHTKELKDRLNFINKNIYVIYHGVDAKKFNIDPNKAKNYIGIKGTIISTIGFLFRYKGIKDFIKATKGLIANILIIGSGPSEKELKKFADFISPHKITFIPYVSDEDLAFYIAASDVIVFPRLHSKGEASGVLVQAMAAGRAIVASNIGCFKEYLSGNRGILVEPENINQINKAILYFLNNEKQRLRYGIRSRDFAQNHLDWKIIARKHCKLYSSLRYLK